MNSCTLPLREALNHTISSGRFADTKIILYSRRDASGIISRPKALYANSHVLKSVPYFDDLLSGEFAESEQKDFSEPVDEGEQAENYSYYSDSDLEDDEDAASAERAPKKTNRVKSGNSLHPTRPAADCKKPAPAHGEWKEHSVKGTVIKIHDIAFITFQAFLMYLYTDKIKFAPYGSEENRKSRSAEIASSSMNSIPRPSPKSIYRLADKYDIPYLKELALYEITDRLEECDTVEEAFSEFSSNYEEIRSMHVNRLALLLSPVNGNSAKDTRDKLDEKIQCYVDRELDHAADAVSLLWKFSRGSVPVSLTPAWPMKPHPFPAPPESPSLKIALIKSIRSGVFFDRKYWVRNSETANDMCPVHMSSVVAGKRLRHINNLVKLRQKDEPIDTSEWSEDSDWENEMEQANEQEETKQEPLPVLKMGSPASWKCLFFYLCTDTIKFAPLKSQGAKTRTRHWQDQMMLGERPPTCSPKTIYCIATALGMETLQRLAFNDIRSKVTSMNVITELFSNFTSRQPGIREIQCGLLHDKFDDENTTKKGAVFIESIPRGNSTHCAEALKLALKQGFLSDVSLRCPHTACDFHNKAVLVPPPGPGPSSPTRRCPGIHREPGPYLVCTGCRTSRTKEGQTSCDGCGRRFKQTTNAGSPPPGSPVRCSSPSAVDHLFTDARP